LRLWGRISTAGRIGEKHGVEKETLGGFAKTMAHGVGRENPVCRQSHSPDQAGCFNLAFLIASLNSTIAKLFRLSVSWLSAGRSFGMNAAIEPMV
jgi:hypothetical protein